MIYRTDNQLNGHAMIFDGPLSLAKETKDGNIRYEKGKSKRQWRKPTGRSGRGEVMKNWDDVITETLGLDKNGVRKAEQVYHDIEQSGDLPRPKSVQRQPVWDEHRGHSLDIDRYMAGRGEPYWRDCARESGRGPKVISLLCNLDAPGSQNGDSIHWRGAGAVAVADVLEDAGYMVDMHIWCLGVRVYHSPNHRQFTTMQIKEPGAPLNAGELMTALSAWYLRAVIFGSFACCPVRPRSLGGACFQLGKWVKYMSLEGEHAIEFPVTHDVESTKQAAINILNKVIEDEE